MTQSESPSIPETVRGFLDNAETYLEEFAKESSLEIATYENAHIDSICWHHSYYGSIAGHRVCIQVWTDMRHAKENRCILFLWVSIRRGRRKDWVEIGREHLPDGMSGLISGTLRNYARLRLKCSLALPPPGAPRPKV
ncbi:MAG: hypothetical protein WC866_05940 [Patescibacteria group bacterium]